MAEELSVKEQVMFMAFKPFIPKLKGVFKQVAQDLIKYLQAIPLQEGETHAVSFTYIEEGIIYLVIGAFKDKTYVRFIEARPMDEWIYSLIENSLNSK